MDTWRKGENSGKVKMNIELKSSRIISNEKQYFTLFDVVELVFSSHTVAYPGIPLSLFPFSTLFFYGIVSGEHSMSRN